MQGELTEGIEQFKKEVEKATAEHAEALYQSNLVRAAKLVVRPEGEKDQPQGRKLGANSAAAALAAKMARAPARTPDRAPAAEPAAPSAGASSSSSGETGPAPPPRPPSGYGVFLRIRTHLKMVLNIIVHHGAFSASEGLEWGEAF